MLVGLDLDNTIVSYDVAINELSRQHLDLPADLPRTKLDIRDYLRSQCREEEWTVFQGQLYGPGMCFAQLFPGVLSSLHYLVEKGFQLVIISHRSRQPYAGPSYDLHSFARSWVKENLLSTGLFTTYSSFSPVNFLETREAKIQLISDISCDYFLDDLPEVLCDTLFPSNCVPILFDPNNKHNFPDDERIATITSWSELSNFIFKS